MAKIKNTTLYNYDALVSMDDHLIGSDADTSSKKTKNYRIGDIASLIIETIGIPVGNGIVNDGGVYWIDNLDFGSTVIQYFIGGDYYSAAAQALITLSPAHATLDRKDCFVVDTTGTLIVLEGTPAVIPIEPSIDPSSQIKVECVTIGAATTVPDGVTQEQIYDENAGEPTEWNATESTGGARINVGSTNNPDSGSICIEATSFDDNDVITFTNLEVSNATDISSLNFKLRNKRDLAPIVGTPNELIISVNFYYNSNLVSTQQIDVKNGFFGFDETNTTTYQTINIPSNIILFTEPQVNKITLTFTGGSNSGIDGFYIDDVRFIFGLDNPIIQNSFLNLVDTFDIDYTGKAKYSPLVTDTENGLILKRTPQFSDIYAANENLNGGVIPLTAISIYDFQIWSTLYRIANVTYPDLNFPGEVRDDVTISTAHATLDRFVIFYIENDGVNAPTVGFYEGTAAVNPQIPFDQLNLSIQVLIGTVRVTSLAGTVPGPTVVIDPIYLEADGEPTEWTIISTPTGVDTVDTAIAYAGTKSILIPEGSPSGILKFQNDVPIPYDPQGTLDWAIKLDTKFIDGGTQGPGGTATVWKITLRDNTLGVTATLHAIGFTLQNAGLNFNQTNNWQLLQLTLDSYNLSIYPDFGIDEVWFEFINTPKVNFDNIQLQVGIQTPGGAIPDRTSQLINDGEDGINPYITINDIPSASDLVESVTVGENVVNGDIIYLSNDGKYWKTNATSKTTSTTEVRMALATILADATGLVLIKGSITLLGLTAGDKYWLQEAAGTMTNDVSGFADTSIVRYIGTALSATEFEYNPDKTSITADGTDINDVIITGIHEGYSETGTRSGGDLIIILGDYDDSGNEAKLVLDTSTNIIESFEASIKSAEFTLKGALDTSLIGSASGTSKTITFPNQSGTVALISDIIVEMGYAASDEISDLEVQDEALRFRMPFAMTLTNVIITANVGPTGSKIICDLTKDGVSVLSTLVSIDAEVTASGTITCLGVLAGDTVTVNGLVYTAVAGAKSDDTEFSIDTSDTACALDLADSIDDDVRAGTINDLTATSSLGVVTAVQTIGGAGGNATTLISSNGTRLAVSGSTFSGGLTEETSNTASVPVVISDSSLPIDTEISLNIDQVGSIDTGRGLKVWLIGNKA